VTLQQLLDKKASWNLLLGCHRIQFVSTLEQRLREKTIPGREEESSKEFDISSSYEVENYYA